jgi:hypothetical protein
MEIIIVDSGVQGFAQEDGNILLNFNYYANDA